VHPLVKKSLLITGLIILVFFVADRVLFFKKGILERTAATLAYPFITAAGSINSYLESLKQHRISYTQLYAQHKKLTQEYEHLLGEMVEVRALHHYDELSKDLAIFAERYNLTDKLRAKILVKNIDNYEHYFLINVGAREHVQKDMIAVYKFQLVGRVTEVYNYYSKVTLITDKSCKVAAYASATNAHGIVHGKNHIERCTMAYVSHLFPIKEDDVILSSGQGLVFPEGFCLGKITSHTIQDKALYHEIELEPLIDLRSIKFCLLTDQSKINLF